MADPVMADPVAIDIGWRRANPLPVLDGPADKEARGRVVVVGGSRTVPGAIRLTGEAALRVGAGKLRFGTVASAAVPLGMLVPEAGVVALAETGEGQIGEGAHAALGPSLARCDALVLGPAMGAGSDVAALLAGVLGENGFPGALVLDAAALTAAADCVDRVRRCGHRVVLTPHPGEMAGLLGIEQDAVLADLPAATREAAGRYGATVVMKTDLVLVGAPDGTLLSYRSDAAGLGTAGSGDVLAGAIGGLLARGAAPAVAAGWGVWLHGQAGQRAAARWGAYGFLARDLLPELPLVVAASG